MPKKPVSKITVTVDLDAILKHALAVSKKNKGLESSSGITPEQLEEAWDYTRSSLPKSEAKFVDLVSTVIGILTGAHDQYAGDGENEDEESEPE